MQTQNNSYEIIRSRIKRYAQLINDGEILLNGPGVEDIEMQRVKHGTCSYGPCQDRKNADVRIVIYEGKTKTFINFHSSCLDNLTSEVPSK